MPSTNRVVKEQRVSDLHAHLTKAQAAVLVHCSGITVESVTQLRSELRKSQSSFRVIKNTLAERAIAGTPLEVLKAEFVGPTGLAYSSSDPVALAKTLAEYAKKEQKLLIRAGVLGGKLLKKADVEALASLPSREVLLSRLVGSLQSPYAGLVYALSGLLRKLVYALEAIRRDKESKGA